MKDAILLMIGVALGGLVSVWTTKWMDFKSMRVEALKRYAELTTHGRLAEFIINARCIHQGMFPVLIGFAGHGHTRAAHTIGRIADDLTIVFSKLLTEPPSSHQGKSPDVRFMIHASEYLRDHPEHYQQLESARPDWEAILRPW